MTAVAWHPVRPQLLAFGCDSGAVGTADTASGVATAFTIRHKARALGRCLLGIVADHRPVQENSSSAVVTCHVLD